MHENNFEKRISEKMQELGFDPTDAVWSAVDKEINKEKKRRPMFWLLFLSGLVLLGGGFYLGTLKNYSNKIIADQQRENKKENQGNTSTTKTQNGNISENATVGKTPSPLSQGPTQTSKRKQSHEIAVLNSGKEENSTQAAMENNRATEQIVSDKVKDDRNNTAQADIVKDSTVQKTLKKDATPDIKIVKEANKKNRPSMWQIGFTGSAGISKIDQSLFNSANISGLSYNPSYFASISMSGASAPTPPASPKITPGFSFGAGVFVNRYLSKRISLSAGIDYHYYSTKILTGNAVDSSTLVYPSYPSANSTESYYRNGNEHSYTNQYHFIELPVTINMQLNKSGKIPLYWKAGFSLSYMMSSNALHFDSYGNVYYQNTTLFNKFQFNGLTSFMIGFHLPHGELQLGPQLQYGLTGLLKQNPAEPGHLLYGGLKISYVFSMK
jgi:hypothetical protein